MAKSCWYGSNNLIHSFRTNSAALRDELEEFPLVAVNETRCLPFNDYDII